MNKDKGNALATFVKQKRKLIHITQIELADKAGVGLRFVRDLEQGKTSLRMDKVNDVLILFGAELAPSNMDRSKLLNNG
jgi:y4mF family transcriptional regulator